MTYTHLVVIPRNIGATPEYIRLDNPDAIESIARAAYCNELTPAGAMVRLQEGETIETANFTRKLVSRA